MIHRITSQQVGVTPDVAFRQAIVMQQRGDLAEAEKIYRAILQQYPRHFQTLLNLGAVLLLSERIEESVRFLSKALKQEPHSAVVHTLLARGLALLDRHEEALKRARRAVALDPELPEAHATLAQGLADLGHYDEAILALGRAIELAPDQARFYYYWGHITRWRVDDPRLAALEALGENRRSRPLTEQVELNFALGKAYADCGDVERAFPHQVEGGALQRRIFRYDEASILGELEDLCDALDAKWMERHRAVGDPSPLPVFIVGMPRSGTTLVEQILASHPRVRALGERLTFNEALAKICKAPTVPSSLAQRAARWSDSELRRLGVLYLEASRRGVPAAAARIIDKLPANFRFVGLIHAALPNARIIHTSRDPVDTCLSLFSILFPGLAHLYSYDLGELGRYYRGYEKVMAHWRNVLPDGVMLEVRYEDVVDDLERQARRIVAHCGLEWDNACLEFHKTERPVLTVSHAQVRQPIYRSSVGRARPPPNLLRPLMASLGTDWSELQPASFTDRPR
jgi:tetratricopeptide (TPR) repeat protein